MLTLKLMLSLLFFLHSRYECEEGMAVGDIVMRAWPGSWCGKAGLIQSMM